MCGGALKPTEPVGDSLWTTFVWTYHTCGGLLIRVPHHHIYPCGCMLLFNCECDQLINMLVSIGACTYPVLVLVFLHAHLLQ